MKVPAPSTIQTQPAWEGCGEPPPEEGGVTGVEGSGEGSVDVEGTVEVEGGGEEGGGGTNGAGE